MMDKITELEQRIDEYRKHSVVAEKVALRKLESLPRYQQEMNPQEVLRRELLRHHTRTLLLDEIKLWIEELKGVRLYQLYLLGDGEQGGDTQIYQIRQHMTEKEAAEVNATYESNNERLRWKPVDVNEEEEEQEEEEQEEEM